MIIILCRNKQRKKSEQAEAIGDKSGKIKKYKLPVIKIISHGNVIYSRGNTVSNILITSLVSAGD